MALATLFALATALNFYGLGSNGIHTLDEAWHAQAAVEMHDSGDFWRPTAFGRPFFHKPTLPVYLMASTYSWLGSTALATRLWSAVFAVATVLATYLLGERLGGRRVGFVAAFALATSHTFIYSHCARTGTFDSMMVFFFVLASYFFLRATETGRGWLLAAAAAGMASHAKNLAGVTPAIVFLVTLIVSRPAHRPSFRQGCLAIAVFLAVQAVWLVPMLAIHGAPFFDFFVGNQLLDRAARGEHLPLQTVLFKYILALLAGMFPWAFIGISGSAAEANGLRSRSTGAVLLLAWFAVLCLVFVFVLRRGMTWYVAPIFPFFAIAGARLLLGRHATRWQRRWWILSCAVGLLATILMQRQAAEFPFALWGVLRPALQMTSGLRAVFLLLVAATATGLGLVYLRRRKITPAFEHATPIALTVFAVAALLSVLPPLAAVAYQNPYMQAVASMRQTLAGDSGSLVVGLPSRRFDILTRHYFKNLPDLHSTFVRGRPKAALNRALTIPDPAFCLLLDRHRQPSVPADYAGRVIFQAESPTPAGRTRLYLTLLQIDPLPAQSDGR